MVFVYFCLSLLPVVNFTKELPLYVCLYTSLSLSLFFFPQKTDFVVVVVNI